MKDNNRKKILIAEDDEHSASMLRELLTLSGYNVTVACDGLEALEYFKKDFYPVVITDIEMPHMDGNELITRINGGTLPPVILVTTVNHEFHLVIEVMKKGVFDYLVKPLNLDEVLLKVQRAFESFEMKKASYQLEKEKILRLEKQLEWYQFTETVEFSKSRGFDQSIFDSFHTAFNQGLGFGSLVSLINLVDSTAKKEGDKYLLDEELFNLIKQNNAMAQKALNTFGEINRIISNDMAFERITLRELYRIISGIISETSGLFSIKKLTCSFSDYKDEFDGAGLMINRHYLTMSLKEILINACKFSANGSGIYVILGVSGGQGVMQFISEPAVSSDGTKGIPMEYENMVFEPFFRLTRIVYDDYPSLDFGCGLTLVKNVIKKHEGKVTLSNVRDMSDLERGVVEKVNCEVILPLDL